MRLLINYESREQPYLIVLTSFLKKLGFEAVATSATLSIGDMIAKAQSSGCQGIFLINSSTLANCVTGINPSLDYWRGSLLKFSVPTIVGNSLLHIHTVPYGLFLLEKDLNKFKRLSEPQPEFSFTILDSISKFQDAFSIIENSELIAYDVETKTINEDNDALLAGDTIITCCSWSCYSISGSITTFVLPLFNFLSCHWDTEEDLARAISFLREVNALDIPKVMHNGMYDCLHSIVYRAYPRNWTLDTMAMMHAEFSELPKSLDFVASITLPDYCQWKGESELASKSGDIQRYWTYNAKDTFTTLRICLHYLKNLPAYARKNYQEQFKLVYPALYCAFEGIKINQEKRIEVRAKEVERLEKNLSVLRTMLSDKDFNPGSPKQVVCYIYDVLGANDPKIGKKKNSDGKKVGKTRATDEKNMKAVGEQHPILLKITDAIVEYREAKKAVSTYMDFLQKNGRLLYSLNPFGTETERFACQSSSFWCGTQVQNIPFYAKDMLIADEGYELFEIDNNKSEARCTAYLAQDLALIKALEDKEKDFYKTLGTLFFAMPYETVTEEFRNDILKKINHGTNYMMGAKTFIENAGAAKLIQASVTLGKPVTLQELPKFAHELLESYHIPFPRVRKWYQEVKNEVITTKRLTSPLGHIRIFFGDVAKNHQAFNSAVAHAPQNLSVSILNKGFWKAWQICKNSNGVIRIKAQVHDSILGQKKIGEEGQLLLQQTISSLDNPVKVHGRTLSIPTDCKVGKSWGSMTKMKK